jgi:casein kinase 1
MHNKLFIHRDIKPDNFLIGLGPKIPIIYMIDYGLAKRYRDPKTMVHSHFQQNKSLTGTARYASVNAHLGYEQSRRDDLESIAYVLLYFLRGSLPWMGLPGGNNKNEKYQRITQTKISLSVQDICRGAPTEFSSYLAYCKSLKYEQTPDYEKCKDYFKDIMDVHEFESDNRFDWLSVNEVLKLTSL